MTARLIMSLVLCIGLATGCSRKSAPVAGKIDDTEARLQAVMTDLDRLMLETNMEAAVVLMENTWRNPDFAARRGWRARSRRRRPRLHGGRKKPRVREPRDSGATK